MSDALVLGLGRAGRGLISWLLPILENVAVTEVLQRGNRGSESVDATRRVFDQLYLGGDPLGRLPVWPVDGAFEVSERVKWGAPSNRFGAFDILGRAVAWD